jgi:nucleoside-diphosphate-sugar epimerase
MFRSAVIDVANRASLEHALLELKPEVVINCAVYGVYRSQSDESIMNSTNFSGLVNIAEACAANGVEHLIHTGSCSEFGAKLHPVSEEEPLDPHSQFHSAYTLSKVMASNYLRETVKERMRWNVIRPFTPFGYWEDRHRLVSTLMLSAIKGTRPKLSSPDSKRDFIFIEDLASAYESVLSSDVSHEFFNIGSGNAISVLEMSQMVDDISHSVQTPEWGAASAGPGPPFFQADISKAKKMLGWSPRTGISPGLSLTFEWFKSHLKYYED